MPSPACSARPPPRAQAPQGDDIGYVQWGATAELLSVAFWQRALDDGGFSPRVARRLRAARDADRDHLRQAQRRARRGRAVADDFEIALPARAFRSRERILAFGAEIEQRVVGVYLDGVARTTDQETRLLLGRLLVSDGQHLTVLRGLAGDPLADTGLRNPLRVEPAGEWLDRLPEVTAMRRLILLTLLALAAAPRPRTPSTVYAAASLREAFPRDRRARQTYNFAGSNQLQAQIERGAPADVFASASPTEAQALFRAGRCTRPVTFATNIVVMLVPADNPAGLRSIYSLGAARSGGSRSAPRPSRSAPTRASCSRACG